MSLIGAGRQLLLNQFAPLTIDLFGRVNAASIFISGAPRAGSIELSKTPSHFFIGAFNSVQTSADYVKIGLMGTRLKAPPNGGLQIGRQP